MKTACTKQPAGAAVQEMGAAGTPMWYMWRGQLHVGTIDIGFTTLWSEHMTCIPALGGVLKMTQIAKYEDLWTKILQSKPCSLSQRNAVSIRGRTVAVHKLQSHSRSFQQLVEELTETSKPQLLVCHLLNDKHHVEVVLVPHCLELEQCGLHSNVHQKHHMLHIMFVCQQSAAHIPSVHQPLDAVDLSQMSDPSTPNKKSDGERLVTGLQFCKKNDVRKIKTSDYKVLASQNFTNITADTGGLANKRNFFNMFRAPPSETEVTDLYDGRHASENIENTAMNIDIRTKESCKDGHQNTQSLERDDRCVTKSEVYDVISTAREQLLENPVQKFEAKVMENNDSEKGRVQYTTKVLKVFTGDNDLEQLPELEEIVTRNVSQDEKGRKIRSSSKSVSKFTKVCKQPGTMEDTLSKMESGKLFSGHLKCSGSHFPQTTDLDSILLKDDKLNKKVYVLVKKLCPSLVREKEEEMSTTQLKNRSLLDTQKFRSLFSLRDSGKPDIIKPSMLKRNSPEIVYVTPSSIDVKQEPCIRPNNEAPWELISGKETQESKMNEDKNRSENCNNSPCQQMNDSTGLLVISVDSAEIQKTANEGDCFPLERSQKKCDTVASQEEISGSVKNPLSKKSKDVSDIVPKKDIRTHGPTKELDFCPNTEQSQGLEDRYSGSKQTFKMQEKNSCSNRESQLSSSNRQVSESKENKLMHTSPNDTMQQNHENNLKIEKIYRKRKRHKRKLEYEWTEAVDNFHPRKKSCQFIGVSNKKCVLDIESEMIKTPITDNGSFSSPVAPQDIQEKVDDRDTGQKSSAVPKNVGFQTSDYSEQQDKRKQKQQTSEIKDTRSLKHSKSSHINLSIISDTLQSVQNVQRKDCQEMCDISRCTQDNDHNCLMHQIDSTRTENLDKTIELDIVEKHHTKEAEKCGLEKEWQVHGHSSAVSGSQCESPLSSHTLHSLFSNSADTAVSLSAMPKITHGCCPKIIGAASPHKQGLSPGSRNFAGILCNEGFLAKHSEAEKTEYNPIYLQCKSHQYRSQCHEIEKERQESNTNFVAAPKLSDFDQLSFNNVSSSNVQNFTSQCKQDSFGKDDATLITTCSFQQPLKVGFTFAEENKYKEVHPINPALSEISKALSTSSPCPKVLAKRILNNIKYYISKLNSSLGSSPLGFGKYECLPMLQASVDMFFISQHTPKQTEHSGTCKSMSSESISLSYGKVVLQKILDKMRRQLLRDTNLINDVRQYRLSSGMKTLASFIDGQVVSPSQATDLPEAVDNPGASVLGNTLSPQCVNLLIAQQVSELHCPYKTTKKKIYYSTSCRVVISSGQFAQRGTDQGVPMNSSPTDCSLPQEAGQQHSPSIFMKNYPLKENISSAPFSSSLQNDQSNKIPKTMDRPIFVPNELYQPCWKDFPCQHPLDGNQDSKFIHLFQGKQQDVIKFKCLLVTRKKSYGTLRDVELYGGHVLVQCTVLDQLLACPRLPKLCSSPNISFGVYGSLVHVMEGKVGVVLADARMLLLLHHSALLDPNTGSVLQVVGIRGHHHMALVPAHTLRLCANLLIQRSKGPAQEKYREILKQNLTLFMKCVESGAGHILGGSQESVCASLSPASSLSEYLMCLRIVHRCLNFANRYTAVLIGEGIKETRCHQVSIYRLCSGREVLQDFPVVP